MLARSWPRASAFDAVDFTEAASLVWAAMDGPAQRGGVTAGWLEHSVPVLNLGNEDRDIADLLDRLSDIVSASDWIQLGESYARALYETKWEPRESGEVPTASTTEDRGLRGSSGSADDAVLDLDLTDNERELLRRGLQEWGGPAHCTDAMAVTMGFSSVAEVLSRGEDIAVQIQQRQNLTAADWQRALMATDIAFASDVVGSGVEWSITTGFADEETVSLLRSVQRKLVRADGYIRYIPRMPSRIEFLADGRKFSLIQTPTDDIRRASLSITLDDAFSWTLEVPGWRPVAVGMSGGVAYAWSARSVIVMPADPVQVPGVLSVEDEDIVLAFRSGKL